MTSHYDLWLPTWHFHILVRISICSCPFWNHNSNLELKIKRFIFKVTAAGQQPKYAQSSKMNTLWLIMYLNSNLICIRFYRKFFLSLLTCHWFTCTYSLCSSIKISQFKVILKTEKNKNLFYHYILRKIDKNN